MYGVCISSGVELEGRGSATTGATPSSFHVARTGSCYRLVLLERIILLLDVTVFRDVKEEDFGNYTCHATNPLGHAR